MLRYLVQAAAFSAVFLISQAHAEERTVKLVVDRMTCASCPIFVRSALREVRGVKRVTVSLSAKTATVTFDDSQATVRDLTDATNSVGYPSRRMPDTQ